MREKILKNWFEAFNQRVWEAMESLYSPQAVIHGRKGDLTGGNSVVKIAKEWLHAIPDAKILPLITVEESDDLYIVHWKTEGTFTGSIDEFQGDQNKVSFHGHTCFRFDGDQVVEHWASVDYRALRRGLCIS